MQDDTYAERDPQSLWTREYDQRRGIDLHYCPEEEPQAVTAFEAYLESHQIEAHTVLDVGCGLGRVGMHLLRRGHHVIAFDYVNSVVNAFLRHAEQDNCADRLQAFVQDMNKPWCLAPDAVDAVFAVTVINNLVTADQQNHFKRQCLRALRDNAVLVVETYLPDDGYYGPLLTTSMHARPGLCRDPENGLTFRIFSRDELMAMLTPEFQPVKELTRRFKSHKYGRPYDRHAGLYLFTKTNQP